MSVGEGELSNGRRVEEEEGNKEFMLEYSCQIYKRMGIALRGLCHWWFLKNLVTEYSRWFLRNLVTEYSKERVKDTCHGWFLKNWSINAKVTPM